MSHDDDPHQLKIKKLQERLSTISSDFRKGSTGEFRKDLGRDFRKDITSETRKDSTNEIQDQKQVDARNVHAPTTASPPVQVQQKQTHGKTEKELSVEEILQQLKQIIDNKQPEIRTIETQQKQTDYEQQQDLGVKIQDAGLKIESSQSPPKQKIEREEKQWQPWRFIPREKLGHLEKKTLNKFLKKQ